MVLFRNLSTVIDATPADKITDYFGRYFLTSVNRSESSQLGSHGAFFKIVK